MTLIKLICTTVFTSIVSLSFCQQETTKTNCSILKHGKFKYIDIEDTSAYVIINNTKHIEYHNNNKYYIKSDIKWLSDCEYEMTMTEITIPNFPFKPGDLMNVKVNKIENEVIYYTSTVNGSSWPGRFKIIKE